MGEWVSPYIIAAGLGWIVAQFLKYVVASIKTRRIASLRQLYMSGSMPSAHSATVVALLVTVGVSEGINSAMFGLALAFSAVVMYDALMVRRSSGEQGLAITALILEQDSKVPLPRVAKGHTPLEVAAGAIIGCVIGLFVSLVFFV